ncbi:hypothetical protein BC936DRAFT_143044 [Jimgerdemannia flammicorona]|uniref:Uncharacterized protein n=2 Tax=Jimgerdemannia flammicorona TaxID=994334 RepID=A0A433Q8Z0_9FUNG|nr:hypothetical protein BC936DRAFT_143044 [Jimgerdemannia flammicorona]RUS26221.1 hypothetical protein BC938DRAFT_471054 [Jimgerdemannia flammicorona]
MSTQLSLLILGHGWTGPFLTSLLSRSSVPFAATTRTGRDNTIPWSLDPTSVDVASLPLAETVLVTFPLPTAEATEQLMDAYETKAAKGVQWIQLSSTRPYTQNPSDRHTKLDPEVANSGRHVGEEVVLKRGGVVLHLSGLWGGERQPRNWIPRFSTPAQLRSKILARPLHLIHGADVARAILATHAHHPRLSSQRWIVSDGTCYDWMRLMLMWGSPEQRTEIEKLRREDDDCRVALGEGTLEEVVQRGGIRRRIDPDEFWETIEIRPEMYFEL